MTVTRIEEIDERLRGADPEVLREMVFWTAHSHIAVCELTSREGECSHVEASVTRERLDSLSVPEMTSILAPVAWLAIDVDRMTDEPV